MKPGMRLAALRTIGWLVVLPQMLAMGLAAEPEAPASKAPVRESVRFDPDARLILVPV